MLLTKKIGWLSLTSFEFVFFDTNMVSDTIDVVHCCNTIHCNYRPQFLLRQHAQPREHLHGNHQKVLWKAQGCHPWARKVRPTKIFFINKISAQASMQVYARGSWSPIPSFNKQSRFVLPYCFQLFFLLGRVFWELLGKNNKASQYLPEPWLIAQMLFLNCLCQDHMVHFI